ncbi:unnamed protein product [Plutella xylostella]|uniref:(diamondback moth) hypothetical protein n=1 Tax=Plutella xylostella TaxID=51655 RepID=A0A8S4FY05_PLUXY|nr:unnamed protein product [Plutella xylostella]
MRKQMKHVVVSILYADVVNYTMISTTLAPERMVELLNGLFGRFDEASEMPVADCQAWTGRTHNRYS